MNHIHILKVLLPYKRKGMKNKCIAILVFLISAFAYSQDKVVFMDSLYREVNGTNYQIKRVIVDFALEKNEYKVFEYNQENKLLLEGTYADKISLKKIGAFTSYYPNGNKKELMTYSEFKLLGKHLEWYENGNKKLEGEYVNAPFDSGKDYKIENYWDENNVQKVIDGTGDFYNKNKLYVFQGAIKNGFKDGEWKGTMFGTYQITENYQDGKLISGTNTDRNGTSVSYTELERRPEPVDGMSHFYKYIGNNFNYTKTAIKNNVRGKIMLQFVVDKEGKITEIKIIKGLGFGLDEEAIRVVSSYKNWIPGKQRGREVRCSYNLPLSLSAE